MGHRLALTFRLPVPEVRYQQGRPVTVLAFALQWQQPDQHGIACDDAPQGFEDLAPTCPVEAVFASCQGREVTMQGRDPVGQVLWHTGGRTAKPQAIAGGGDVDDGELVQP